MTDSAATASVLRALTSDRTIRFSAVDASVLWDGVRRGHPHLEAEACACLTETLAGALLLQARTFFSERLQMLLKPAGRAKAVVADAWPTGDVRGVLDLSEHAEGPWVAPPGLLQVMRSNPKGQPFMGHLELVEGPIQAQVEAYLQQSEQVQASCVLWCDPRTGHAGGLLVEPLPACPSERLRTLLNAWDGLEVVPLWERDPTFLARWINQGEGSEVLAEARVRYACRCTETNLLDTLSTFPEAQLAELLAGNAPVEVRCDYCGKIYLLDQAKLTRHRERPHA